MRGNCLEDDLRYDCVMLKVTIKMASQLFVSPRTVLRTVRTFLNTGDVKPCRLGRPTGRITLFPHEKYVVIDCVQRKPQIQLYVCTNFIFNAAGLFCLETLCCVVYRLGMVSGICLSYL